MYKLRFNRNREEVTIIFSHVTDLESKVLELIEETPPSELDIHIEFVSMNIEE